MLQVLLSLIYDLCKWNPIGGTQRKLSDKLSGKPKVQLPKVYKKKKNNRGRPVYPAKTLNIIKMLSF